MENNIVCDLYVSINDVKKLKKGEVVKGYTIKPNDTKTLYEVLDRNCFHKESLALNDFTYLVSLKDDKLCSMSTDVKGLCTVNRKGLQKIHAAHPNIPAVQRHINNPNSKMQYSTALYIKEIIDVPLSEIIEIP